MGRGELRATWYRTSKESSPANAETLALLTGGPKSPKDKGRSTVIFSSDARETVQALNSRICFYMGLPFLSY